MLWALCYNHNNTKHNKTTMRLNKIIHPATVIPPQFIKKATAKCLDSANTLIYKAAKASLLKRISLGYTPRPLQVVDIGFYGVGQGHEEFTKDAAQAYGQALAYLITGNETYARNSEGIIDQWASICRVFRGDNAPLEAAWGTAAMSRACEILKYTYKKWNKDVESKYISWVKRLLMPHLRGETNKHKLKWAHNNWHTSIVEARLQYAFLCDDLEEANWCINEYLVIFNNYVKDNGFTSETLRDSDHCCFGIAGLVQVAEMLLHQGIDMYSLRQNLIHKVVELHAGIYGLKECPQGFNYEQFNVQKWIQPSAWEIARYHFAVRKKILTPKVDALLTKIRPCKYELHWGYDTLTHACC
jgi:Alginate lyase